MTRAFRSEILKLSRRTMLLGAFGTTAVMAVLGVMITITRAGTGRDGVSLASLNQPDGFAQMMQRGTEMFGIVALGVVAITVAQDYSTGMLRSMLMREPRRLRLLAGKLAADLGFAVVAAVAGMALSLLVALAVGPARGVHASQWLSTGLPTTLAQFGVEALVALGFGIFGAVLAIVLRNPAPAIIAGVAWALPIEGLLGRVWSSLEDWLPVHQLSVIASRGQDASLATALLVAGGFAVAALAISGTLFHRSDVVA